jgi:hypothetical protein
MQTWRVTTAHTFAQLCGADTSHNFIPTCNKNPQETGNIGKITDVKTTRGGGSRAISRNYLTVRPFEYQLNTKYIIRFLLLLRHDRHMTVAFCLEFLCWPRSPTSLSLALSAHQHRPACTGKQKLFHRHTKQFSSQFKRRGERRRQNRDTY